MSKIAMAIRTYDTYQRRLARFPDSILGTSWIFLYFNIHFIELESFYGAFWSKEQSLCTVHRDVSNEKNQRYTCIVQRNTPVFLLLQTQWYVTDFFYILSFLHATDKEQ